jgi:bud site selection protein 20
VDDLPAGGEFHCHECDRYFVTDVALATHTSSKIHRRRMKELKQGAFTQKEAEESVGLKTDKTQRNKKVEDVSMA